MKHMVALLVVLLAGCSLAPFDRGDVVPARLQFYDNPVAVSVPSTVARNTALDVEFTTYGGGCIEPARNRVVHLGMDARIYSTQRDVSSSAHACLDFLRFERNVITLRFPNTGTAIIRIYGKREPGNEPLVIERAVTVTE